MGETRVDLLHLLEDLADAYPNALDETILTEIVANSLDSGAARIGFLTDPAACTLTVMDDGRGMRRAELRRFHDIAASSKTRGEGIGFAGVGIKLGLLVSDEVMTETRRGKDHVATTWALANRKRAPWRWVPPLGLVQVRGTAVRLKVRNALSPLLDPGFIERTLRLHFTPLFDDTFDDVLAAHYPLGITFTINERAVERVTERAGDRAPVAVRLARKRRPSALGYLARRTAPPSDDERGVAISTLGKVIRRGWDWLGVSPASADLVNGLVEVPELASCLTLNKADFLRSGPRGALFLAHRKALQEVVSAQLAVWGSASPTSEERHRRATRPVERDVEHVLAGLTDRYPVLAMLARQRPGGTHKLPSGRGRTGRMDTDTLELLPATANPKPAADAPVPDLSSSSEPREADESSPQHESQPAEQPAPREPSAGISLPGRRGPRRPVRLGLSIRFESREDVNELARLIENVVWVNDAHPAYRRAAVSRSEGYHVALAVAMALAEVAAEPAQGRAFVTEFLSAWGAAGDGRAKRRGRLKPAKR